jgi:hypothetical protein
MEIRNRKLYIFLCWMPVVLFLIGIGLIIGGFLYNIQELWVVGLCMTIGMLFTCLVMFTKWWIKNKKK